MYSKTFLQYTCSIIIVFGLICVLALSSCGKKEDRQQYSSKEIKSETPSKGDDNRFPTMEDTLGAARGREKGELSELRARRGVSGDRRIASSGGHGNPPSLRRRPLALMHLPPEPAPVVNDEELVQQAITNLQTANIAFNTPEEMFLQRSTTIQLLLSPVVSKESLETMIAEPGGKASAVIKMSTRMSARLEGDNFQRTALTSEEQVVDKTGVTGWKWDVTPLKTGKQKLHLTVDVILSVNHEKYSRTLRTFDREIVVHVKFVDWSKKFWADNWHWVIGTLGSGSIGGGILKWIRKKKRQKSDAPHPHKPRKWFRKKRMKE